VYGDLPTNTKQPKQAELAGLYEEYYDRIVRYAYSRMGDKTGAEDITGEVFLKAIDSLGSYREQGIPMQAWLFKIAHNLVVDYLRKASKFKSVSIDDIDLPDNRDIAAAVETNMEIERVNRAMRELTADQQEVIRLRYYSGLASREVAALMNKTDGAVREMQRAALEKLRAVLGEA